ncbi:MAG: VCBS repeat-containing protein [Myxococcota bacterium]
MDSVGLDTRWWNLSVGILAVSVVGCGPSIVLIGDTEGGTTAGDDGADDVLDGIDPTGGVISCTSTVQCPDGLVCIDNVCVEENVDYSDYVDDDYYTDENIDYSDYNDDMYCYEYAPNGECCGYEQCCEVPDDCEPGRVCVPGDVTGYCAQVATLQECPPSLSANPLTVMPTDGPVVSLAFVEVDGLPGDELLIGHAGGGADLVIDEATPPTPLPLPTEDAAIVEAVSGDVNDDGLQDLVIAFDDDEAQVLVGDGLGGFTADLNITGLGALSDLALADFNGDASTDLIMRSAAMQSAFVLLNDAMFSWTGGSTTLMAPRGAAAVSLATGQFDDGPEADVFVSTEASDALFFGQMMPDEIQAPNGVDQFLPPQGPRVVFAGDPDGNGIDDMVGATQRPGWVLVESNGEQGASQAAAFVDATPVGLADVTGDGRPDLVLLGSELYVLPSEVGIGVPFNCYFAVATKYDAPVAAALGDLDADGRADIAITDGTTVTIIRTQ